MADVVDRLFLGLFAMRVSSLGKYLFVSLAHFLDGLLVSLLLSFENTLYILDRGLFVRSMVCR